MANLSPSDGHDNWLPDPFRPPNVFAGLMRSIDLSIPHFLRVARDLGIEVRLLDETRVLVVPALLLLQHATGVGGRSVSRAHVGTDILVFNQVYLPLLLGGDAATQQDAEGNGAPEAHAGAARDGTKFWGHGGLIGVSAGLPEEPKAGAGHFVT
jgi:hypothetical protein